MFFYFLFFPLFPALLFSRRAFLRPTAHRPTLSLGVKAKWLGRHCETGASSLLEQMTCKPHQIIKFPQAPPAKGVCSCANISASVMRLRLLLTLYQQDPSPPSDYCITGRLDCSITALAINSPLSQSGSSKGWPVFVVQECLHAGAQAREDGFAAQRLVASSSCVPLVGAHEIWSLLLFPPHTPMWAPLAAC